VPCLNGDVQFEGEYRDAPLPAYFVQIGSRWVNAIDSYCKVGDEVELGTIFGMIRIGSQVDRIVPARDDLTIQVQPSDTVRAGETILVQYVGSASTQIPRIHSKRRAMLTKRGKLAVMLLSLLGNGCTWVPLAEEGAQVQVRTADQVQGCEPKGRVTAVVKHKIGGIMRSEEKVREELRTMARNEAARMASNALTAETEPTDGRQVFLIYRCP